MHKLLLALAFMRNNKALVISVSALIVFVVYALVSFARIEAMKIDIESYQAQITVLNERTASYERMLEANEGLIEENDELNTLNSELNKKNDDLVRNNKNLITENHDLAAENDELERLNGELLKKFDGLSRPN